MWVKHQRSHLFSLWVLISSLILFIVIGSAQEIRCPIRFLYNFGDSSSDTGNSIRIVPLLLSPSRLPYGETFPGSPTGRWSNGRLIIDYIAMSLGLPLLNPNLDEAASFDNGVNFAVGGSLTNDISFFLARGILSPPIIPPLRAQLRSFKRYLNSTPTDKVSNSLAVVGETGYNDFALSLFQGRSIEEVSTYVPSIVQSIIDTIRGVIKAGVSQVLAPGNVPIGCFPWALRRFGSNDPNSYDDIGCLKSVNSLAISQNDQLKEALDDLRNEFPNAVILYVDYYNTFESILRNASALGFDTRFLFKPCCGSGTYNVLDPTFCGNLASSTLCPNPNNYIHWDGVHPTQETYRRAAEILIRDLKIKCT